MYEADKLRCISSGLWSMSCCATRPTNASVIITVYGTGSSRRVHAYLNPALALVELGPDLAALVLVGGTRHLGLKQGLERPLGLGEELGAGVGPGRKLGGGDGDGRAREVAD